MSGGAKTPWNWSSSSSGAPQTLAMKSKENEPVQKPSSRARLIKLASENNVRKDSKGAGKEAGDSSIGEELLILNWRRKKKKTEFQKTDDTLEHLWASGHEEEVERHLLKGPAGTVIAHQKGQIAELRKALKESVEEAKRQEMRARELQRFLEEVEQQGEDNREAALQLEQMKLRAGEKRSFVFFCCPTRVLTFEIQSALKKPSLSSGQMLQSKEKRECCSKPP